MILSTSLIDIPSRNAVKAESVASQDVFCAADAEPRSIAVANEVADRKDFALWG